MTDNLAHVKVQLSTTDPLVFFNESFYEVAKRKLETEYPGIIVDATGTFVVEINGEHHAFNSIEFALHGLIP